MPNDIFGQTIHDNCERRGHFENGEFVYEFGSEEEAEGYCLYPLGCRGPQTKCQLRRHLVEQPPQLVRPGRRPLHRLLRGQPQQPGPELGRGEHPVLQAPSRPAHRRLDLQPGTIALAITGTRGGRPSWSHGFGMKVSGRMDGGAPTSRRSASGTRSIPTRRSAPTPTPVAGRAGLDDELLQKNAEPRNNDSKKGGEPDLTRSVIDPDYPYRGPSPRRDGGRERQGLRRLGVRRLLPRHGARRRRTARPRMRPRSSSASAACAPCSHAHASSIAGDKAYGITISNNARIVRNLLEGAQFLHSHILWLYNLAALDYVNPLNALQGQRRRRLRPWPRLHGTGACTPT